MSKAPVEFFRMYRDDDMLFVDKPCIPVFEHQGWSLTKIKTEDDEIKEQVLIDEFNQKKLEGPRGGYNSVSQFGTQPIEK